jgi:raffinose/stachyose/melibiose transport system permease protein
MSMAAATLEAPSAEARARKPRRPMSKVLRDALRWNWLGGLAAWFWFFVVLLPIYWVVITSFKDQNNYYQSNQLAPPGKPTLENYRAVLDEHFIRYLVNSVIVTVGAVVPAVLLSFMAAYAIIRDGRRLFVRSTNGLFLMGLAIPLQATIIPIFLVIIKLHLYDTLLAMILPSIAFAIPLSVLVLSNFIRDVPNELFESMRVDGASDWQMLWRLAFPLTRPALITVTIYNGLTIWNGFLLPLVLTQSPDKQTVPLALSAFQGQFGINFPAVMAAVLLSLLPILALYILARRHVMSGLSGGFTK